MRFSLFSGSFVARDLAIADDPAFSPSPFVTAREMRIGVEMKPLIVSRQIKVRSFAVVAEGAERAVELPYDPPPRG